MGRRILVTRRPEQTERLASGLAALGASVVEIPTLELAPPADSAPLDRALAGLHRYDWIVFTSANAVRAVGSALRPVHARVAAVGPATADAVRALGIEPAFVPDRFSAGEIADGLEPLAGTRVLLPQSEIAERSFADGLRARGATVDAVDAYRTVAVEPTAAQRAQLDRADAILLASGSAARSLAAAAVRSERTLVVCIGPSTAEAARAAGLAVDLVAEDATGQGMIHALVTHFGESR
jgi:uroporphyrinogen-III synthase